MRLHFRTPLAVMLGPILAISVASPAQAATTRDLYLGEGYGSYSFVGGTAMTGKTAHITIGCQTKPGTHLENTMQSNNEQNQNTGSMKTGSVPTTTDAIKDLSTAKTLTSALANGADLLGGLVTASRVRAVSATISEPTGMRTSAAGTYLSNLVVVGHAFATTPGPNTRITLAKFGYVVLNEQYASTTGPVAFLSVNGMHVYITEQNLLGIPVGSQFIVSHAYSALKPTIAGIVGGQAYGHKLFEGGRMQSGPSAIVYMPCAGTGGKVVENNLAGVTHSPTFTLGEIRDTAAGVVTSTSASSETTSSIQSVNVLAGLITADLIKADARATKNGSSVAFSDAGSEFVNLVVAGQAINGNIAPNTSIELPGMGTLWLHRVVVTPYSIEVRMIDLAAVQENPAELQPGSKLQLAVARALVLP